MHYLISYLEHAIGDVVALQGITVTSSPIAAPGTFVYELTKTALGYQIVRDLTDYNRMGYDASRHGHGIIRTDDLGDFDTRNFNDRAHTTPEENTERLVEILIAVLEADKALKEATDAIPDYTGQFSDADYVAVHVETKNRLINALGAALRKM